MAIVASRFGRKNVLGFGLIVIGLSAIGIVSTKNILIMQVLSVTFGIGQTTLMTFEAPFIYSESNDESRIHAFSASFAARNAAFMMGSLFTGILADIIATRVATPYLGIRYALITVSLMSFVALIPLALIKGNKHQEEKHINFKEIKNVYSKKLFIILIYTTFIGFGAGMVVPFFGVYLKYQLDITDSVVGTVLAIAQMGTVLGGLTVPLIAKRFGKTNTITLVQMGSIPFLILIGAPMNLVMVAIAFFFRSSLMNMAQPLIQNLYMEVAEEKYRPLVSSLRSTVNNISRAGGIILGGYMMANISYSSPYIVTITCYFIGTIIFRSAFKSRKQPTGESIKVTQ